MSDLRFGSGEGEVFMSNVQCLGTEERLVDCPSSSPPNCSHNTDVGVRCQGKQGVYVQRTDSHTYSPPFSYLH